MSVLSAVVVLVLSVQDKSDRLREQYEEQRMRAKQTAEGQFAFGKWCDSRRLREEAIKAYERAIEIDPEYLPARQALGHKKVLGRWTSEKIYADTSWWAHPSVDQKKVDEAIVRGAEYLLSQSRSLQTVAHPHGKMRYDELVLLTLIESGIPRNDTRFLALLNKVLGNPMDYTYHVALKAMCLASLDPIKYQQYLAQCAQFLVDCQCENGQWSYGKPSKNLPPPGQYVTSGKPVIEDIETGPNPSRPGEKLPPPKQIEIKKTDKGPATGDNSNTQYAALGLRACLSGLVIVPKETVQRADKWWTQSQKSDGGWGYTNSSTEGSWGSMTAGAVGSVVILKYYLKRVWNENVDWKADPSIERGCAWMGQKLTFAENPMHQENFWIHYYIYAVERAGRLVETERFGAREWYPEGANLLLGRQTADGSWTPEVWGRGGQPMGAENFHKTLMPSPVSETCFAILFLRRATPKISETFIGTHSNANVIPQK